MTDETKEMTCDCGHSLDLHKNNFGCAHRDDLDFGCPCVKHYDLDGDMSDEHYEQLVLAALKSQAQEIASQGINGCGNTTAFAPEIIEQQATRIAALTLAVVERDAKIEKLRKALDRILIDWNDGVVSEVYRGKPGAFDSATYRIAQARAVLAETAPKVQS